MNPFKTKKTTPTQPIDKRQKEVYKKINRKVLIEQHVLHQTSVNSGAPEGCAVLAQDFFPQKYYKIDTTKSSSSYRI